MRDLVATLVLHLGHLARFVQMQLVERYFSDADFQASVDNWMRIVPGGLPREAGAPACDLARAAQLSAYHLVSRLIYYQTLQSRFRLPALPLPDESVTNADLRRAIAPCLSVGRQGAPPYGRIFGAALGENPSVSAEDLVFCGPDAP